MSDIETTLRSLAKSGRLNHVSVGFINGKWSGSYRGVDHNDFRIFAADDPVSALIGALTGKKVAPPVPPKVARATKKLVEDEDLL